MMGAPSRKGEVTSLKPAVPVINRGHTAARPGGRRVTAVLFFVSGDAAVPAVPGQSGCSRTAGILPSGAHNSAKTPRCSPEPGGGRHSSEDQALSIRRDKHAPREPQFLQGGAQGFAGQPGLHDGVHVRDDDGGVRAGPAYLSHIGGIHIETSFRYEAGGAGAEHDDARLIGPERFGNAFVPDGVTGEIQRLFSGVFENDTAGGTAGHNGTAARRRSAHMNAAVTGRGREHAHVHKA